MNPNPLSGRRAVVVFACFALGYFMSYGLRSVNAVIASDLVREFGLSNAQLGSLSAAYFLAFAMLQLPLGIWLDRFGSRRTDAGLLTIAALGCAVFASAHSVEGLWLGRALIGAGVAGALMSALKGYRFWYAPQRQQPLAAWMLVAGTGGALSVTVPVQLALPLVGWRGVFWAACALVLAAAIAIWTVLPRDEERAVRPQQRGGSIWAGYGEVFASPYFWRFGFVGVIVQSNFVSMQSLWAGPWFQRVLQMSPEKAAQALFAFNLVLMGAYLGLGWALPRLERRGWTMLRIVAIATVLVVAIQCAIGLVHQPWAWVLWLALSLVATPFTAVQPHVSLSFRAELTGRAYTGFNLLVFGGIFLNQWIFGVLIDLFKSRGVEQAQAFGATMLSWQVLQVAALAILLFWKARPPGESAPRHATAAAAASR